MDLKRVRLSMKASYYMQKLGFIHPTTQEYVEFDSELPDYFEMIINKIKHISS